MTTAEILREIQTAIATDKILNDWCKNQFDTNPTCYLGIDEENMIAVANLKAHEILKPATGSLVGFSVDQVLPVAVKKFYHSLLPENEILHEQIDDAENGSLDLIIKRIGKISRGRGIVLTLCSEEQMKK